MVFFEYSCKIMTCWIHDKRANQELVSRTYFNKKLEKWDDYRDKKLDLVKRFIIAIKRQRRFKIFLACFVFKKAATQLNLMFEYQRYLHKRKWAVMVLAMKFHYHF